MGIERPTFHESWRRVAALKPRLRTGVNVRRQPIRGEVWHVIEDPSGRQFFRVSEPAWRFIGMLDGRMEVAEAWRATSEQLGDDAPTQGEAISLLGDLFSSNLLHGDVPADAETMFRKGRKRAQREMKARLSSLFFLRIPLIDPDHFLTRWAPVVGWLFTPVGLVLWLALLAAGAWSVAGKMDALTAGVGTALAPGNLAALGAVFVLLKLLHEFGHGFACKVFGLRNGTGGAVHTMGVMLLVFMPVPYVDATSAWAFRSKAQRVVVSAAGMIVELAVAAVAAMVWARTAEGTVIHAVAWNAIFLASVSTLVFNGNPLLRYDGYYILSDLVEAPNLAQRSMEQVKAWVKRRVWGVKRAQGPARSGQEAFWLSTYAVCATVYRVVVLVGILLFIADQRFLLGAVLVLFAVVAWVALPIGKFLHYLLVNPELERTRVRAVWSTAAVIGALVVGLGMIPAPDYMRAEGVVEPARMAIVHAEAEGVVTGVAASGTEVDGRAEGIGAALVSAESVEMELQREALLAERRRLEAERRVALAGDAADAQRLTRQIAVVEEQIEWVERNIRALEVRAPVAGVWVAPEADRMEGAHLARGQRLGLVASLDDVLVRAVANQRQAALLMEEAGEAVEMRVRGRPAQLLRGRVQRILPAGQETLPSAALGYLAGGGVETDPEDEEGRAAAEPVFEVRIALDEVEAGALLPGQRVIARFRLHDRPLLAQFWRAVRQVAQERFRV